MTPLYLEDNLAAKSLQLCPILCDPIDGSPPGSTIPGILQARTMEWVAISFSRRITLDPSINSQELFISCRLCSLHNAYFIEMLNVFPWINEGMGSRKWLSTTEISKWEKRHKHWGKLLEEMNKSSFLIFPLPYLQTNKQIFILSKVT